MLCEFCTLKVDLSHSPIFWCSDAGDFAMAAGPASPCPSVPSVSSTASSPLHLPAFKKRKTDYAEGGVGALESMGGVQGGLGCMEGVGDVQGGLGCVEGVQEGLGCVEGVQGGLEGGDVVEEVEKYLLCSLRDVEESSVKASVKERRAVLSNRPEEDADELFGRHIAANLRRLTNRQKAEAKVRIQQVMIEVEFPEDPTSYSILTS